MLTRKQFLAIASFLFCVVASSCGGGDKQDAPPPTTETAAPTSIAPATTEQPATTVRADRDDEQARAEFCAIWNDTMPAMFALGLAGAFADDGTTGTTRAAGTDTSGTDDTDEVLLLLISPRLEGLFTAAAEATSGFDDEFRAAAEVMANGSERLADAGLTDEEIDALRNADLSSGEPPTTGLDDAALKKAAAGFRDELDQLEAELGGGAGEVLDELINSCQQVVTGGVDTCELIDDATVESVVGQEAQVEGPEPGFAGGTSCVWEGVDGSRLAVSVADASYYEQVAGAYDHAAKEAVTGVGDEAFVADGFNYASGGGTSGRSLFVKSGDRTVVVAIDHDGDVVATADLRDLADDVLKKLD